MNQNQINYSELEENLRYLENVINTVSGMYSDEYDPEINFPKIMKELYNKKRKLKILLSTHKFNHLDKEEYLANSSSENKKVERYRISDFETLESIATKFSLSKEEILSINNITTLDFMAGETIGITIPINNTTRIFNSSVIGGQSGLKYLGRDLPNKLTTNTKGDLEVLNGVDTFQAGVINRIKTYKNTYVAEKSLGVDYKNSDNLSTNAFLSLISIRVINQLLQDERIKDIEYITVNKNATSINISVKITGKLGEEIEVNEYVAH